MQLQAGHYAEILTWFVLFNSHNNHMRKDCYGSRFSEEETSLARLSNLPKARQPVQGEELALTAISLQTTG